jgi:hypothetical protein
MGKLWGLFPLLEVDVFHCMVWETCYDEDWCLEESEDLVAEDAMKVAEDAMKNSIAFVDICVTSLYKCGGDMSRSRLVLLLAVLLLCPFPWFVSFPAVCCVS